MAQLAWLEVVVASFHYSASSISIATHNQERNFQYLEIKGLIFYTFTRSHCCPWAGNGRLATGTWLIAKINGTMSYQEVLPASQKCWNRFQTSKLKTSGSFFQFRYPVEQMCCLSFNADDFSDIALQTWSCWMLVSNLCWFSFLICIYFSHFV